jgi:hypothetical protein
MQDDQGYFRPPKDFGPAEPSPQQPEGAPVHDLMPYGPWSANAERWDALVQAYDEWRQEYIPKANPIDEFALMFFERDHLFNWISAAVKEPDVRLFNYANDTVHTQPFRTHYRVEYWFLTHPDRPYRLELMLKGDGFSPLHDHMANEVTQVIEVDEGVYEQQYDAPAGVHVSAKLDGPANYASVCGDLADMDELEYLQFCRSDYGHFSYWRVNPLWTSDLGPVYFKPRVNLRDSEVPS